MILYNYTLYKEIQAIFKINFPEHLRMAVISGVLWTPISKLEKVKGSSDLNKNVIAKYYVLLKCVGYLDLLLNNFLHTTVHNLKCSVKLHEN